MWLLLKLLVVFFLIYIPSICADEVISADQCVKRVYAHLLLQDPLSACEECKKHLHCYPSECPLWHAYIKALAKKGDDKEMLAVWNQYVSVFPEERENHDLIESMAWGVIEKSSASDSPAIRTLALLGAFFGQDSKGVTILCRHFSDPNTFVRKVAVQLSSDMRDAKLRDGVLNLFQNEKCWQIHIETIKSVGKMKIAEAKPGLLAVIADGKTSAEEKAAAIEAIVRMTETIDKYELERLVKSDRAGLRLMACQIVHHLDLKEEIDGMYSFLQDRRSEVRAAILNIVGSMRITTWNGQPVSAIATNMLSDPDPTVGITAAWLLTLYNPEKGQKALLQWFNHESRDIRLLASAALSETGTYGNPLISDVFKETKDPYIKMNLALGLIAQQMDIPAACEALYLGLTTQNERWMWLESGNYRVLIPSSLKQSSELSLSPEALNQLTRLEILNLLAVMKYSKAQEAIKHFLRGRSWGLTGTAAALLLTEGDETAIDLIRKLLDEPEDKIRIQAALILALWGRDEHSIQTLQQAYPEADRELKERILEGVGRVGDKSSIPFLVEKLGEPYQSLRIIAASSLLECLYH